MPDLNAAALFVRVSEFRSFSEASKRLGIPISTVSRKISELEKALGVRLLERSTRHLRITELGAEYYQYCRRGLEEIEAGGLALIDRQTEVSGTLRLSIPPNLADVLVTPLIIAFQKSYPKSLFKVMVTERYVDLIEDNVDVAMRVGQLDDSSLIARRLLAYRHILVASPGYIKLHGQPTHPDDLQTHRLITFGGWHEKVIWELKRNNTVMKVSVDSALSINEISGIQYVVENDQGIAQIPAMICAEAIQQGRLVEIMTDWKLSPTFLSFIYPSKRNTSRLVSLFIDYCIDNINKTVPDTGMER